VKLSSAEIAILVVGLIIVIPVMVAVLTPTPDAITMGQFWLGAAVVFLVAFFLIRLIMRRR
jgi:hypothetical protein